MQGEGELIDNSKHIDTNTVNEYCANPQFGGRVTKGKEDLLSCYRIGWALKFTAVHVILLNRIR